MEGNNATFHDFGKPSLKIGLHRLIIMSAIDEDETDGKIKTLDSFGGSFYERSHQLIHACFADVDLEFIKCPNLAARNLMLLRTDVRVDGMDLNPGASFRKRMVSVFPIARWSNIF